MLVACKTHGNSVAVLLSPDMLSSDGVIVFQGTVYEYFIGSPADPWHNCFITVRFAEEQGLDYKKGWEPEGADVPEWFNQLVMHCEYCFSIACSGFSRVHWQPD